MRQLELRAERGMHQQSYLDWKHVAFGAAEPRLISATCANLAEKSKCNEGLHSALMSEACEYLEVRGRKILIFR